MNAAVYFHRKSGTAFVCGHDDVPRVRERLEATLGAGFVPQEWEVLSSHGGALRITALDRGHLNVTSVHDDSVMAG
jgi:hypothetical protein